MDNNFWIHADGYFYQGDETEGSRPATAEEIEAYFNPVKTLEDKIAELDKKYEAIFNDCLLKIGAAVGADGTTQDSKVVFWQNEYKAQIANKKTERLVIMNG